MGHFTGERGARVNRAAAAIVVHRRTEAQSIDGGIVLHHRDVVGEVDVQIRRNGTAENAVGRGEILVVIKRAQVAARVGHEVASGEELQIALLIPEIGYVTIIESEEAEVGIQAERNIPAEDTAHDTHRSRICGTRAAGLRCIEGADGHTDTFTRGGKTEGRSRIHVHDTERAAGGAIQFANGERHVRARPISGIKIDNIGALLQVYRTEGLSVVHRTSIEAEPAVAHVEDSGVVNAVVVIAADNSGSGVETIRVVERDHAATLQVDVADIYKGAVGPVESEAPFGPALGKSVGGVIHTVDPDGAALPRRGAAAKAQHVDITREGVVGGKTRFAESDLREATRALNNSADDHLSDRSDGRVALLLDGVVPERSGIEDVPHRSASEVQVAVKSRCAVGNGEEVDRENVYPVVGGGEGAVHGDVHRVHRVEIILEEESRAHVGSHAGVRTGKVGGADATVSDLDSVGDVRRGDADDGESGRDLMPETGSTLADEEATKRRGETRIGEDDGVRRHTPTLDGQVETTPIDDGTVAGEGTCENIGVAEIAIKGADNQGGAVDGATGVDKRICIEGKERKLTSAGAVAQGTGAIETITTDFNDLSEGVAVVPVVEGLTTKIDRRAQRDHHFIADAMGTESAGPADIQNTSFDGDLSREGRGLVDAGVAVIDIGKIVGAELEDAVTGFLEPITAVNDAGEVQPDKTAVTGRSRQIENKPAGRRVVEVLTAGEGPLPGGGEVHEIEGGAFGVVKDLVEDTSVTEDKVRALAHVHNPAHTAESVVVGVDMNGAPDEVEIASPVGVVVVEEDLTKVARRELQPAVSVEGGSVVDRGIGGEEA